MPPLLADFIHTRGCKPICAKLLTLPSRKSFEDWLTAEGLDDEID